MKLYFVKSHETRASVKFTNKSPKNERDLRPRFNNPANTKDLKSLTRRTLENLLPGQMYVITSEHYKKMRGGGGSWMWEGLKRFSFKKLPSGKYLVTRVK